MVNDSVLDRLYECLGSATKAHRDGTASPVSQACDSLDIEKQSRLHWLDTQLSARVAQLQGLALDMESGLSVGNLGYSSDDEFDEMLEDIACEVRQLQRMIREVSGHGR